MLTDCPHCHVRVLVPDTHLCPSCGKNVKDRSGADTAQRQIELNPGELLPPVCVNCGEATDRLVRVRFDDTGHHPNRQTLFSVLFFLFAALVGYVGLLMRRRGPEVDIEIGQCKPCSKAHGKPIPRHVDWSTQRVTLLAHKGFVKQLEALRQPRKRLAVKSKSVFG